MAVFLPSSVGPVFFSPAQSEHTPVERLPHWLGQLPSICVVPHLQSRRALPDALWLVRAQVGFSVTPTQGTLAPRGGANNVCDPTRPYSDSQQLKITHQGHPASEPAFLVVKTEEEQWTFKLVFETSE